MLQFEVKSNSAIDFKAEGRSGVGMSLDRASVIHGEDGKSAYEIALENGFEGTEQEWLDSLHGKDGLDGAPGPKGDSFTFEDFTPEQLEQLKGEPGKDGLDGAPGKDGKDGYTPIKGVDYFDGQDGAPGKDGEPGEDGYTPVKGIDYFDGQDGKNTFQTAQTVVLTVDGWAEVASRRFAQTVAVNGVTTDPKQVIVVDVALTGSDLNADNEVLAAWGESEGNGPASQNVVQGEGTLTFYCLTVPAVNIPLNVGVG